MGAWGLMRLLSQFAQIFEMFHDKNVKKRGLKHKTTLFGFDFFKNLHKRHFWDSQENLNMEWY